MKKLLLLSAALFSIIAISSCEKEIAGPDGLRTVISVTAASTKTALGEKEGTSWPNYWKTGDQICVNGLVSEALGSDADGKDKADFSFESALAVPYYAAYPVSAVSGYSAGSATLSVPASQNYVAGSYDPAAFVMYGKSDTEGTVELEPLVSVIHLKLTGSASISKVKLTCAADAALSGSFTTDFTSCTKATVSNEVEMVAATAVDLPADFFICVPAGLSGQLQVDIFDSASGSMSKTATLKSALAAGQMYLAPELPYVASAPSALTITAEGITSSTAVICVTGDPADAYTFNVYSDAACSTLVDSYAVDAGNSCWGSASPRFCISGLTASTPYYVKVTDVTSGAESDALTVTTAAFQLVQPGSTAAAAGDVLLAEDFGELRWDSDVIGNGVGYFPTSLDSFANTEVSSFQAAATSNEKQISAQATALAASRLAHWAQGANPHMYIHPGYIKLVGNSKVTHLVTPALDNIPDGMVATLEVKVTASAYYSESSGSFATTSAIVAVQTASGINEFGDDPNTNTLDLTTNVAPITLKEESAWNEYTVTLTGVGKGARLAFGAAPDVTNNNARMNISDITVTLKSLEAPSLTASVKSVSSSTAAFTWTYGGSAAADIARPYTISLYSNSACTDLVISHDIDADASFWEGKTPCFVFGGLAPDTEYWFVACDTSNSTTSDAVSAKTSAFTVVDVTTVTNASADDVILAEDFSEIAHGADELAGAAGFVPNAHVLLPAPSGVNPEGVFVETGSNSNRIFGSGWNISGSRMDKGWGFFGNSACFSRNGYLRPSSSDGRTHIVTPALSCIPAGKQATIEVTVTAAKYSSGGSDVAVFVENGLTMNSQTDYSNASFRKYTGASLSDGNELGITSVKSWSTKSVTISKVNPDSQLLIGSLSADKDTRFYLNDIVVKVVSIDDIPLKKISDDATFLEFVDAVAGGDKTLDAEVTQDITLASATVAAFNSIENYEGVFDGGSHTIAGLTEPLFATLKGTVKDLTLNSTISSSDADDAIWGILAKELSAGSVNGCTAKGSITYSATDPSEQAYIGGVVGKYSGGTLSGCYNEASITYSATGANKIYIGGVVSNNESKTLSDCHSTAGTISVTGYSTSGPVYVGGVVGYDTKTIDSCTNAMTVDLGGSFTSTATQFYCVGGVVAKVTGGSITNSLNTGEVIYSQKMGGSSKGYTFVGGLVGQIKGSISNSSNGGTVSFTGKTDSQNPYIGGIVGSTDSSAGSITGKYSTASATNYGAVIVNSSQSKKYVYVGGIAGRLHTSNTMTATNNGPITITKLTCTQAFIGGLAGFTNDASSTINTGSSNMAGGVITITELTGNGTSSYSAFIGGVVGQAKGAVNADNAGNLAINGLNSKLNSTIGGIVGRNLAAVSGNNVGDIVVSSGTTFVKSAFIGGILGRGENPVSSSTNSGLISNAAPLNDTGGYLQVGGVVGYNNSSCTITDCHNTGVVVNTANVEGYLYVGGITSESDALISGCTNTGDVSNSGDSGNGHPICIGGITGVASANVEDSSNGTDTQPGGTISNSGDSAEDICIGGVIGWNNNKTVTNCFNKGDVTNSGAGGNIAAGGVVGWSSASSSYVDPNTNTGTITNTGTASSAAYTGEIIGHQAE